MHKLVNKRFTKSFGNLRRQHLSRFGPQKEDADVCGELVLNEVSINDSDLVDSPHASKLTKYKSVMSQKPKTPFSDFMNRI